MKKIALLALFLCFGTAQAQVSRASVWPSTSPLPLTTAWVETTLSELPSVEAELAEWEQRADKLETEAVGVSFKGWATFRLNGKKIQPKGMSQKVEQLMPRLKALFDRMSGRKIRWLTPVEQKNLLTIGLRRVNDLAERYADVRLRLSQRYIECRRATDP